MTVNRAAGEPFKLRVRFLSSADTTAHQSLIAQMDGKDVADPDVADLARRAIAIGVVGWDRPDVYAIEGLERELTRREFVNLAMIYPRFVEIAESDEGKSLSRLAMSVEPSAQIATPQAVA